MAGYAKAGHTFNKANAFLITESTWLSDNSSSSLAGSKVDCIIGALVPNLNVGILNSGSRTVSRFYLLYDDDSLSSPTSSSSPLLELKELCSQNSAPASS
jgi:hypothetical protein